MRDDRPMLAQGGAGALTSPAPPMVPIASTPTVDPTRLERLRSDAMLGLVIGIALAVIAAAAIFALWAKMHGVPPGTY
jgi:hypothetical protein